MALRVTPGQSLTRTLRAVSLPGTGPLTAETGATVTMRLTDAGGATAVAAVAATASGADWTATLTMPTAAGRYWLVAAISYAGATTEQQEAVVVSPFLATRGVSRRDLRRMIGRELGDLKPLVATAAIAAPATTFTDDERLIGGAASFRGRTLYCARTAAANAGKQRLVTAYAPATSTISFRPSLDAAFAVGDEVELWNDQGLGWTPDEVHDAIDAVILEAGARGGVPLTAILTDEFDDATGVATLPDGFAYVDTVAWEDAGGYWHEVRAGSFGTGGGWWVDDDAGTLGIGGDARWSAAGGRLRVSGTGVPDGLQDDEDRTEVNAEALRFSALARLMATGRKRDPERERLIGYFQRMADQRTHQLVPPPPPGSVRVR